MQSAELNELAKALATAQLTIEGASKDAKNPFFKSSYADLASVWNACHSHLNNNGLAVIQTLEESGDKIVVVSTLIHSSGQWMKSRLPIAPKGNDAQSIGSAITYARRYTLAALVGVCPVNEDDDGEKAVGRNSSATPEAPKTEATAEPKTEPVCEVCGTGHMVTKKSARGSFLGCSNYPACRNTKTL